MLQLQEITESINIEQAKVRLLENRVNSHLCFLGEDQETTKLMQDLRVLASSKVGGMTKLARSTGKCRQLLYRVFDSGDPKIKTLAKLLDAMGYNLTIERKNTTS